MKPAAWRPYPDAAEVLGELRRRGVRVAVVSNIGWDLRPVFRAHGLDPLVDAYALSYEHGVQKPDPRLFRAACDALGVAPRDALMVGDDRRADAGAAALGCRVHLVDHLPVDRRPDGLRAVARPARRDAVARPPRPRGTQARKGSQGRSPPVRTIPRVRPNRRRHTAGPQGSADNRKRRLSILAGSQPTQELQHVPPKPIGQ